MTREDKRRAIEGFCDKLEGSCIDCPLYEIPEIRENVERCYIVGECLITNIDRNYSVLFGETEETNDVVNHPAHYTQGGIECIDAMKAAFGAAELAVYCKIAAFKYIWRCEHKNGIEDIKKAVWYLNKYIGLSESGECIE